MKDLKHIKRFKRFNESEENSNSELSKDTSSSSDVMKCPFCGSENIEPSMFIDEWDCNNCLKNFKKKDFS
jgi:hypothetical protein